MIHTDIAVKFMKNILYDNGIVNRIEPEYIDQSWVLKIGVAADNFFTLHPYLLTDDVIDEIATGDVDEIESKYGQLEGFRELNQVLNEYFDHV